MRNASINVSINDSNFQWIEKIVARVRSLPSSNPYSVTPILGSSTLIVTAGAGPCFEEVEQSAVLEQQLLAAEAERALACRRVRGSVYRLR